MQTEKPSVLAFALGGGSDIIGALAWARAKYKSARVVLVQPGSLPRDAEPPRTANGAPTAELHTVVPAAADAPVPSANFFDNDAMVAYLAREADIVAGYYLTQPKDDGGGAGFSRAMVAATSTALSTALKLHGCTALLALDFGGDVALPEESTAEGPHITQRDLLNLHAAADAARQLGLPITLLAASPGVDAAGVAPEYEQERACGRRLLQMDDRGVLIEAAKDVKPPACTLPTLPPALFHHRVAAADEAGFNDALIALDERIMRGASEATRRSHASKTYHMMAACARALTTVPASPFIALGQFRNSEKGFAHLPSSVAGGVYDLGHLIGTKRGGGDGDGDGGGGGNKRARSAGGSGAAGSKYFVK